MSGPIDLVLSRLDGHKLRENGRDRWRACCPAHSGSNPSALSIGVGDTGVVLLRCWQGCSVDQVAGALGLALQDLFPPKPANGHGSGPIKRRRLISAGQALDLLEREAQVIFVTAHDVHEKRAVDEVAWERLRVAVSRVGELATEARS